MTEKIEKPKRKKLSEQEVKRIIFLSYMFSQGSVFHQEEFLKRLAVFYGKQNFTKQFELKLTNEINDTRARMAESQKHENEDSGRESMNKYLSIFYDLPKSELSDYQLIGFLVFQDIHYYNENGRPNRDVKNDGDNSLKDRFMSFCVNYLVRSQKTGDVGFDYLLSRLRSDFKRILSEKERVHSEVFGDKTSFNYETIQDLIKKYNEKHPKTMVSHEELEKFGLKIEI